jgi:tetratricopeptide (TPR) repeat protein
LQPEFMKYIGLYEKGVPSLTAARQTIGDLHKLDEKLAAYSHQRVFNYLRVKTSIGGGKAVYPSQTMPRAQVDAVIGDFYVRTKRPAEAGRALQEAIRLDPKLAGPYESLGLLALEQRNQTAALKWLGQAVALGSKNYLVYYYHANLLLSRDGRLGEPQAVSDMNRCIGLNAHFAEGYRLLAQLYGLRDEKLDVADGLVRRAIELKPNAPRNYLTLGLVLMRQGKAQGAEAAGKKALTLARSETDRSRAQEFLHQVRQWRAEIAAGSQHEKPIIVFGPSTSRSGPAGQPSAAKKPAAATNSNSIVAPPQGFTMVANGTVSRPQCSGKTLNFLLVVNGSGVKLFAPDESAVRYVGFPAAAANSPCSFLEGRRVAVHFRLVHGKPYFGKILEIDLSR